MKIANLACLPLALAACQAYPAAETAGSAAARRGEALAQASCAACHATDRYGRSPNPRAPAFAEIANSEGLTAETLSAWLTDAHNYPEQMRFTLGEGEVDALVA